MKLSDVAPEPVRFDWNEANREKNWRKHGVSIEEAQEAFLDSHGILFDDVRHSFAEDRYIAIGKTYQGRCMFIVFTVRSHLVRIISARPCKRKEVELYEETNQIA